MGSRRTARQRALQALYQLDVSGTSSSPQGAAASSDALASAWAAGEEGGEKDQESETFAKALVEGVVAHRAELDGLIQDHSHNWRVDRMSQIDRNILRLAVFELTHRPDIPRKVSINEAVELGKLFGSENTGAFVNGILDRIAIGLEKA